MADKKTVKLSSWKSRCRLAKDFRKKKVDSDFELYRRMFDGDHWQGIATTYDQVTINYFKTLIETTRDSVYFQNPQVHFTASGGLASDGMAKKLSRYYPRLLHKIRYKHQTKLSVFYALLLGFGYKYNGFTVQGDDSNECMHPNECYSIWVPSDKVWLDPDAHGMGDSNFCFYETSVNLKEARKNKNYNIPESYEGVVDPADQADRTPSQVKDLATIPFIHVFDRGEGTHKIFNMELDQWIFQTDKWPLGRSQMFPINRLSFGDDALYPTAFGKSLIPINQEMNKMVSMQLNHAKRFNRKYLVTGGKLDPDQEKALLSGIDGAIIYADDGVLVAPIADADLTAAVYRSMDDTFRHMQMISRVGEYRMGTKPAGDTTATEATYIEGGTSLGTQALRDCIGDFCRGDAESLLAIMAENYDTEVTFRYDEQYTASFSNKNLKDAIFEIEVDVEAAAPPIRAFEQKEAMELYNVMSVNPLINPIKPIMHLLRTSRTIKDPEEWLSPDSAMQIIKKAMQDGGIKNIGELLRDYENGGVLPAPPAAPSSLPPGMALPGENMAGAGSPLNGGDPSATGAPVIPITTGGML
jgi:hypothetical protein